MGTIKISLLFVGFWIIAFSGFAQLSPGELAKSHSHLEGLSNCTKCHILGKKVSNSKCLECHTELKSQTDKGKGYHSSKEVANKECISCHSDHHGKKFDMIHFEKEKFNHDLTGYLLEGAHNKLTCEKCHKAEFIDDANIKKKQFTYLGLKTTCLNCHEDYHEKELSSDCYSCHSFDAFKPVNKFDHNKARYKLAGKHVDVDCAKCHPKTITETKTTQKFTGLQFQSCVNCHEDVHKNKFGQNCTQCHNEISFVEIKNKTGFDHNKTNYKLVDLHEKVDCKKCHKTKLTDPVKHTNCYDCHTDYHKGEFVKQGKKEDCNSCHSTKGFVGSSYTIARHNESSFVLEGAHTATPCFECHLKQDIWKFKKIGEKCVDCHDNIHKTYIEEKYIPQQDCKICHKVNQWGDVVFDHSKTNFPLDGGHKNQTCRSCHFKSTADGSVKQQFKYQSTTCIECHTDVHYGQFNENGKTECTRCHSNEKWKLQNFDHDKTNFKLDGKHVNVACVKCHLPIKSEQNSYIQYKLKKSKCEDCH